MKKIFLHISLLMAVVSMSLNAAPVTVTIPNKTYQEGENVSVTYTELPIGCKILLYKDLSLQPMKEMLLVDEGSTTGVFVVGPNLEPGDYHVRCVLDADEVVPEQQFTVEQTPFKHDAINLVVLSDIHVMAPSLLVNDGSAMQNYVSSDRKMIRQSAEIFTAMVDSIIELHPELVLITGDLTKDGERVSHECVVGELQRLRESGIRAFVIPGNHDCNNPMARYFDGDETYIAETITREEFATLYRDFGYDESAERDENSLSYAVEPVNGLVLLGIDSNEDEDNLFECQGDSADVSQVGGRIKPETLTWLLDRASAARAQGKRVIAMMHHHLVQHFDKEASLLKPYIIEENEEIREKFIEAGIKVLFTGHLHVPDISRYYTENMTDSLTEVSNGALVGYPHPFRFVTLDSEFKQMRISGGVVRSIPSMSDLQAQSNATLQACIPSLINRLTDVYYDKVIEKVGEMLGDTELFFGLCNIPETTDELAAIVTEYLGEPAKRSYLLMAEGNEGNKYTEDLRADVFEGIDGLFYAIVKEEYALVLSDVYMGYAYPKLDTLFVSVYNDLNNYGKAGACVVNDLYTTLDLGEIADAALDVKHNNRTLSVKPTFTSGPVDIGIDVDGVVEIYDLYGRLLISRKCRALDSFHYEFSSSGVYIVRCGTESVKVIVR